MRLRALKQLASRGVPDAVRPLVKYYWRRFRSRLDPEIVFICHGLGPGSVALDIGANDGLYTHAFFRVGATVEAFEPQPACIALLQKYSRSRSRVHVHPCALGRSAGELDLVVPTENGVAVSGHARVGDQRSPGTRHRVAVRTLDSFAFQRVDAIKIDVEGHELDVILGARGTIERCRPRLLIEIEQRHTGQPLAHVFRAVTDLGYVGSFLDHHETRALHEFDVNSHQRLDQADKPGGYYINNFLFQPT